MKFFLHLKDMDRDQVWRTKTTETLYENPPLRVCRDIVKLPDGDSAEFDYLDEPDAVVVFPITPEGHVVTISEWRQTVNRVVTGLPGGSLEDDEAPKVAAHRELREESGYVADCIELMNTIEVNNGFSNGRHFHFLATGCTRQGNPIDDPMESTEVSVQPIEDVREAASSGEIVDAKTLTGLFLYQLIGENKAQKSTE